MPGFVIEPRAGTDAQYRELADAYDATKGLGNWPGGASGSFNWPEYRIIGSRAGAVGRFAIATREHVATFSSASRREVLVGHEENVAYIGPLQTLTEPQAIAAIKETFTTWMDNAIARGRGGLVGYGIVPDAWPAKLHNFFAARRLAGVDTPAKWPIHDFILEDGEHAYPGRWHIYWATMLEGRSKL